MACFRAFPPSRAGASDAAAVRAAPTARPHALGNLMSAGVLAPAKCTATAKSTGKRCGAWAIRGASVCRVHGGMARQVQRRAAERLALAEAMASEPHRHPAEVLMDTLHAADLLMRERIQAGTPVDARGLEVLLGAVERAQKFARTVLELDIADRQQRMHERHAAVFVDMFERVLAAAELSPGQDARARSVLVSELQRLAAEDA